MCVLAAATHRLQCIEQKQEALVAAHISVMRSDLHNNMRIGDKTIKALMRAELFALKGLHPNDVELVKKIDRFGYSNGWLVGFLKRYRISFQGIVCVCVSVVDL